MGAAPINGGIIQNQLAAIEKQRKLSLAQYINPGSMSKVSHNRNLT
jgi:hypothetical protein